MGMTEGGKTESSNQGWKWEGSRHKIVVKHMDCAVRLPESDSTAY